MRLFFTLVLFVYSFCLSGQNKQAVSTDSVVISNVQMAQTIKELNELSTKGIDMLKDSLIVSDEFKRLLTDKVYCQSIYPEAYTWEQTIVYIKTTQLKKAFWFLINLYPTNDKNKELVIKSVLSYEGVFQMDQVLINTFYTYAFTDPESSKIVDNIPEITRPDILENKLQTVKELILYIYKYREMNDNKTRK